MKIFFLTKYYNEYIKYFENSHQYVNKLNFHDHQKVLFDDHFSWPSDFSDYLHDEGASTFFSIANYTSLQKKWLRENKIIINDINNIEKKIVFNQIKKFKPDVLWIFAIFDYYDDFLIEIKPYVGKIISWISSPYPKKLSFKNIDYLVSSDFGLFKSKENHFKKVIKTLPGFNIKILSKIQIKKKNIVPKIGFNGQFTIDHKLRIKFISNLLHSHFKINISGLITQNPMKDIIRKFAIYFFNYDFKSIKELIFNFYEFKEFYKNTNFLKKQDIRPVFGLDYYNFINNCDVILNIHSDESLLYGGAQRIIEVTGIGKCLITEKKIDTVKQFDFNKEILGYNNYKDLINLLEKIKKNEIDYEKIGINSQLKTIKDYSIKNMYENVKEILK